MFPLPHSISMSHHPILLTIPKVTVEEVFKTLSENAEKATHIIHAAVPVIAKENWTKTYEEMKASQIAPERIHFWCFGFGLLQCLNGWPV